MPLHDWSNVPAGLFHDFRQRWAAYLSRELNDGLLPDPVSALLQRCFQPKLPKGFAIENPEDETAASIGPKGFVGGAGIESTPPADVMLAQELVEGMTYASKADRIILNHDHWGEVISVIEIVSPGNKNHRHGFERFRESIAEFLDCGVHVLIVDLFPPMKYDALGVHKCLWDEYEERDFHFPVGKSRMLASYKTDWERTAYLEPLAVGDAPIDMPLVLSSRLHVKVPLDSTYEAAWNASPAALRRAVEGSDSA